MTAPRFALTASLLALSLPLSVSAAPYEADIDIENEDDLYELQLQGQISEDEFETLLELLHAGINLDTASREELYELPGLTYAQVDAIIEYRRLAGPIVDPAALVDAGVLTPEELQRIAPFLTLSDRRSVLPVSGKVELQTRYAIDDRLAPPVLVRTRLKLPKDFHAGLVATTTRFRPGPLRFDPLAQDFVAAPIAYRPQLPKYFLQWKTPQRQVIAGTFRIGFGERLTLDNTRRPRPTGATLDDITVNPSDLSRMCRYSSPPGTDRVCEEEDRIGLYNTRDWGWAEGFRGVSASVEDLNLSDAARLALHGFASYQSRSVYQYQLYDRGQCSDPRLPDNDCKTPPIFEDTGGLQTRQLAYATFPGVWNEAAGGGNATLVLDERIHVGLTGYYAAPLWQVDGADLDLQEWARQPFGGPFGAVGLFGSTVAGPFRLSAEGARSFDSMPDGGGGFGAVQRSVWSQKKRELEVSLRYYDRGFANAYARPVAASDTLEGNRARDETGVRIVYLDRPTLDWRLRVRADVWTGSTFDRRADLDVTGRAEFVGFAPQWKVAGWLRHRNAEACLAEFDVGDEDVGFSAPDVTEEPGNLLLSCGTLYRAGTRAVFDPFRKRLVFTLTYEHTLAGSRQDGGLSFQTTARIFDQFRLKLRARYKDFDLTQDDRSERSLWSYAEVGWLPSRQIGVRLRYDVYAHLDQRASTLARRPNPEHRLWLKLESRF